MKKIVVSACVAAVFCGCISQAAPVAKEYVIRTEDLRYPNYGDNIEPVNYGNPDNWLATGVDGAIKVDVFFLYPTSWQAAYGEYPICGINNTDMRHWANYYLKTRASAFETAGNIYAPFYRQLDASFVIAKRPIDGMRYFGGVPFTDVAAAFDYYIENYNEGKPFILAAHSQGSIVMAALMALHLRDRPDVYKRMIAAYLIGMPIPETLYELFPHIKPAKNADDLGVVISYNTNSPVIDGNDPFSYPSNVLINPITWVTDDSYAPKEASKGGIIVNDDGTFASAPNLADAKIDRTTGTLVSNVDREKFSSAAASRGYFPLGVLHENDIPLYYYDLRANAENRVKKWFAANEIASLRQAYKE
jgi:pimeloyl-ACP methyl ester carboxylesterase